MRALPTRSTSIVSGVINPVWAGTGSSSTWDLNTTADWNANTLTFLNGDSVTFDDTGVAPTVNISGTLQPGSVTFNNSAVSYTLAVPASGKITGPGGLTKSGSGTLTITAATSDFTGPVTINGGILSVGTFALNGSASTLGAGTQYHAQRRHLPVYRGADPRRAAVNRLLDARAQRRHRPIHHGHLFHGQHDFRPRQPHQGRLAADHPG